VTQPLGVGRVLRPAFVYPRKHFRLFAAELKFSGHAGPGCRERFPALSGKKWGCMKIARLFSRIALTMALFLTVGAFASNKGSVRVNTTVTVNGKQLAPGDYMVQWEGSGADVQVNFLKGKTVVATSAAHLVDLNSSSANDSAVIKKNDDGSSSLAQIRFGGKKKALAFDAAVPSS
jgi:hypothetical protein